MGESKITKPIVIWFMQKMHDPPSLVDVEFIGSAAGRLIDLSGLKKAFVVVPDFAYVADIVTDEGDLRITEVIPIPGNIRRILFGGYAEKLPEKPKITAEDLKKMLADVPTSEAPQPTAEGEDEPVTAPERPPQKPAVN